MVITETPPKNSDKMTHKGRDHAEKHHLAKIMKRAHNAAKKKQNGKEESTCRAEITRKSARPFTTRATGNRNRNKWRMTREYTDFDAHIIA